MKRISPLGQNEESVSPTPNATAQHAHMLTPFCPFHMVFQHRPPPFGFLFFPTSIYRARQKCAEKKKRFSAPP